MSRHSWLAVLVVSGSAYGAAMETTPAATSADATSQGTQQGAWHGLQVPSYPGATGVSVSRDDDEYELYFRSSDSLQRVFEYYRDFLVRQGFQVRNTDTDDDDQELKANLRRGQGGPDNSIELEVELRGGQYKVEIEFDD